MFDDKAVISDIIHAALACLEDGLEDQVVVEVEKLFAKDPNSPQALHVLGLLAVRLDEPVRAREIFSKAAELAPDRFEHTEALAIINARLGLLSESLFHGKLATALSPYAYITGLLPEWLGTFEDSFMNIREKPDFQLGKYHFDEGNFQQAIFYLQRAAEVNPEDAAIWRMLSDALRLCDRSYEALMMMRSLDALCGDRPEDLSKVAMILTDIAHFEESVSCHKEVLRVAADNPDLMANFIFSLQKAGLYDLLALAERDWASLHREPVFDYDYCSLAGDGKKKLIVALVSSRFRSKSGLDHIWPLIIGHGNGNMAFSCYSYNPYDDIITRKIAGAVYHWADLSKIDDKTAATIIHNDAPDILIDLDSNLEGGRPKLFAYNPVPVMLRYLGDEKTVTDMGFAGVLGGKYAYLEATDKMVRSTLPFAALSPEMNVAAAASPKRQHEQTAVLGLAPSGAELTPEFYSGLKGLSDSLPEARFLLNTRHLGGGGLRDGIDRQLAEYGLADKVDFTILDNDKYLAMKDFIAACDLLIAMPHMRAPEMVWDFILAQKPAFICQPEHPSQGESAEIINLFGREEWIFDNLQDMASALRSLYFAPEEYNKLVAGLRTSLINKTDGVALKKLGREFYTILSDYRQKYLEKRCAEPARKADGNG